MTIRAGDTASRDFVVDENAMHWFQSVSGDTSRIHCDEAYAKSRGYDGVIAYGGIMLAHLSHLLGMRIPGENGTSISWTIRYHAPLYLGEPARISLEVVNTSPATGVVESKFRIAAGERTIASGTAQSIVPSGEIAA